MNKADVDRLLEWLADDRIEDVLKELGLVARRDGVRDLLKFALEQLRTINASRRDFEANVILRDAHQACRARVTSVVTDWINANPGADVPLETHEAPEQRVPSTPLLECRNVTKRLSRSFELPPVSFDLKHGEIAGVVGCNGTGKTTLLRMLAGELSTTSGEVVRRTTDDRGRQLQTPSVFVSQTPFEYGGTLERHLRRQAAFYGYVDVARNAEVVDSAILLLGLDEYRNFSWSTLSAGYRMRAAIAAAAVANAGLLVLDEPLAPLDPRAQQHLLTELKTYARVNKTAIVLSSQHIPEVESIADFLVILGAGRPRIDRLAQGQALCWRCEISSHLGRAALKAVLDDLKNDGGITSFEMGESATRVELTHPRSLAAVAEMLAPANLSYIRDISSSALRMIYEGGTHAAAAR